MYLWCSIPEALSKSLHSNRVTFGTTSKEVGAESAKSCVLPPAVILSRQVPTEPRNDILYNTDMTERDGWEVRSLHKRHAVAMNIWLDKCMPLFFTLDTNTAVQELEHNIFTRQMSSSKWPHKEEVTTSRHPSPSVTGDLTSLEPHSLSASKPAVVQLQTLISGLCTFVFSLRDQCLWIFAPPYFRLQTSSSITEQQVRLETNSGLLQIWYFSWQALSFVLIPYRFEREYIVSPWSMYE